MPTPSCVAIWKPLPPSSRPQARSATRIRGCSRLSALPSVSASTPAAPIRDLHARRYLLAEDVIPFFVLLSLETGLEPECLKALTADCLRNPASGTVEIEYVKRRARGSEWKRLRVRDGASSTPGGIIRTLIELTAAARKHKPSESLWLYFRHRSTARPHPTLLQRTARQLDRASRASSMTIGKPLRLLLSRLRKTHKALWYAKTQGDLGRFAVGHTPEVAARHYADLPSLRHLHEQAVADGLTDALTSALQPRVVTPEEERVAKKDPATLQLPVSVAEARRVLAASRTSGSPVAPVSTRARSRRRASRARSRSGAASNAATPSSPRASCRRSSPSWSSSSRAAPR